jgi:nucleoside-diphosphate-sugar epimerase
MEKILITRTTSFVGVQLAARYVAKSYKITVFDRNDRNHNITIARNQIKN